MKIEPVEKGQSPVLPPWLKFTSSRIQEPPTKKPELEETTKKSKITEQVEPEKKEIKISPTIPEEPPTEKPTTIKTTAKTEAKETTEEKTTKTTTKEESTTEATTINDVPTPDNSRTIHRPLPIDDADNHSDIQSLLIMLVIG